MTTFHKTYDERYASENYRTTLSGYEVARYDALQHAIPRWIAPEQVSTVLDYGSGRGLFIPLWSELFPNAQLHACDVSTVALDQLTKAHAALNVQTYPMPDFLGPKELHNAADVVVSVEVLEHVADLDLYLRDIFQCLKPGGSFIWTTPCGNSGSIEHLYSLLTNNIGQSETGERRWKWEEPTHLRRMKTSELAIRLQAVGFEPPSYRLRSHLFSFLFTHTPLRRLPERYGVAMMKLDYKLFRALPNGASMIGCARKPQKP